MKAKCFLCKEDSQLALATLWPSERKIYARIGIVLRQCLNCGGLQNRTGNDEELSPAEAAQTAPAPTR